MLETHENFNIQVQRFPPLAGANKTVEATEIAKRSALKPHPCVATETNGKTRDDAGSAAPAGLLSNASPLELRQALTATGPDSQKGPVACG